MDLKLSYRDINFIRFFNYYLNVFLITPWYNFETNSLFGHQFIKIYACVLIAIKIFWTWYLMSSDFYRIMLRNILLSQGVVVTLIYTIFTCLFFVTVVNSAFTKTEKFRTFYKNFHLLDTVLQNKGKNTHWQKWLRLLKNSSRNLAQLVILPSTRAFF